VLAAAPAPGQTLAEARALLDSGRALDAAVSFEQVMSRGRAGERAEAASLVLLSLHAAGRHDLLESKAAACRRAAEGTAFAAHCDLYRGRSLRVNAKDTTAARALLSSVAASPASDAFAASGALYEIALIDLDTLRLPFAAHRSLEDLLARYPASPFADDALVALARAGTGMGRLDVIESATARLRAMGAAPALLQKVQFERGEFMAKARRDRTAAAREYVAAFTAYDAKTEAGVLARLRAADMVPGGNFEYAKQLYESVLAQQSPAVRPAHRDWAECMRAVCLLQLGRFDEARAAFAAMEGRALAAAVQAVVSLHVRGLGHPDTPEGLVVWYDRGIRARVADTAGDETFWDMQRVIVRARRPWFERFLTDASVPVEERAQMLYRVAFARFLCGYLDDAQSLAERAL
jgi:tetratricopeptide (TPR) repeat protein